MKYFLSKSPFNSISSFIRGNEVSFALTIGNGIAPFSCCYNGDSACSNARLTNPDPTGQSPCINKQTCTVPPDMILSASNKDGKERKPLDGEEGNLANYRYNGIRYNVNITI